MNLHLESHGSGAPLLLIHGWGMHSGLWEPLVAKLAATHRVHCIDLPGHGKSRHFSPIQPLSLDQLVAHLSARFTQALTLCGWSLGGQVALRWAQLHPEQVNKLVLVATTPCFVKRANWDCALEGETLSEFAAALAHNPAQTLRRFLALQLRGSEHERELLAALRATLFAHGEPDAAALQYGLDILRDTDLRHSLAQIPHPALVLAGERDTLTPHAAAREMAQALPQGQLALIKGAAHLPFLSHQHDFIEYLTRFLDE